MDKRQIEDILISMRTLENEEIISRLLDRVKEADDIFLQRAIMKVGSTKEAITRFFEKKISERQNNITQEYTPVNEMFSYGIANNCAHLHLPMNLNSMIAKLGISGTIDTINLHLLDAIDKIKQLKDSGDNRFQGIDSIYMISPILLGRELRFLEGLDFETRTYKKQELSSQDFLRDNLEAALAVHIFGKEKNVGIAQISLDLISSSKWQDKKKEKLKEFTSKGITFISSKDNDQEK